MGLQRKYFGTDGIRGNVGVEPITPEFVLKLGWAIGSVLSHRKNSKVLIGKDTRISGYLFESALEAGLSAAGVNIHLLGPLPTPGIAFLTHELQAQAGIVISASHNPHYDNGIKIFSKDGFKLLDEVEFEIEQKLEQPLQMVASESLGKAMRVNNDAILRYAKFCVSTVPSSMVFSSIKIVLDCANGATYQVAPIVFRDLGFNVITMGVEPNGLNINQDCGSTHPKNLQRKVIEEKADLGIAFDGDGDRVLMIDHKGNIVDGDELIAIIVNDQVKSKTMRGGVVGTLMSNLGLELALKELNVPFLRAKVGDRYVLEQLQQHQWQIGGEPSGHIIELGLSTTGDGIIAALSVLVAMQNSGKSLFELKQVMKKFPQTMINVKLSMPLNASREEKLQPALNAAKQKIGNKGRVLLRASGTEPVIRVMVEGEYETQVKTIAEELASDVSSILAD